MSAYPTPDAEGHYWAKLTDRQASDPAREVALIALKGSAYPTETMRQVIAYAFDQLCWSMSEPELDQLLDGLRAKLTEDA